jgi:hypothetical protein
MTLGWATRTRAGSGVYCGCEAGSGNGLHFHSVYGIRAKAGPPILAVSGYWLCPVTGYVWLLAVSDYWLCPVIGCVRLLTVSGYWLCPITGYVRLLAVSGYRLCPVIG